MSAVQTSKPKATYQDVLDAPPHKVAEIVDGTLYTHPRPAAPHAIAGSVFGSIINRSFHQGRGGPGGWWIINEPELHLGGDIVVPDVAGWRRKRMPVFPTGAHFTLVPDWVCEVLSPSTRRLDLGRKKAVYAREGAAHHWFIDPSDCSLEAFELRDMKWVLIERLWGNAEVSLPPFEAISFNLGDLWPQHAVHGDTLHRATPDESAFESDREAIELSK